MSREREAERIVEAACAQGIDDRVSDVSWTRNAISCLFSSLSDLTDTQRRALTLLTDSDRDKATTESVLKALWTEIESGEERIGTIGRILVCGIKGEVANEVLVLEDIIYGAAEVGIADVHIRSCLGIKV